MDLISLDGFLTCAVARRIFASESFSDDLMLSLITQGVTNRDNFLSDKERKTLAMYLTADLSRMMKETTDYTCGVLVSISNRLYTATDLEFSSTTSIAIPFSAPFEVDLDAQ